MRRIAISFTVAGTLAGCIDGFRGSNIQIDLSPGTPSQVARGQPPGMFEFPSNGHFRIYAIDQVGDRAALFEIQRFEIHKIVDVTSPCFIDVGPNVPFPGIHVSEFGRAMATATGITDLANPPADATEAQKIDAATAVQRMQNVAALGGASGIKVVVSASASLYPAVDADCGGTGLPPPACTGADDNARRLAICQATWAQDPDLFEGTDRVLTSPLNGTTFGMVDGLSPVSPVPIGGAQFFVDAALDRIDQYTISFHLDGTEDAGTLLFDGVPVDGPRGVRHVHLESPLRPGLVTAEMVVFANLGEDTVHF